MADEGQHYCIHQFAGTQELLEAFQVVNRQTLPIVSTMMLGKTFAPAVLMFSAGTR